jgi:atypical dual specificity phosphatase
MRVISRVIVVGALGLLGTGCSESRDVQSSDAADAREPEARAMQGFSWIEDGQLAAMPRPGRQRPLDEDLAFLQSAGITILVSLTSEPVPREALARHGMEGLHLPVEDFTPPTLEQMDRFLREVEEARVEGGGLGIHCTAGKGRTGTMLAAYLVTRGLSAPDAVAEIRRLRPGSVETPEQEDRVAEFARIQNEPSGQY